MEALRSRVTLLLVSVFVLLLIVDCIDDLTLGNRFQVPTELFGLVGAIIAGLYTASLIRRNHLHNLHNHPGGQRDER